MLVKLIDSASFFREDEVQVSLLNLKDISSSGLEKVAADQRINEYVAQSLKPKAGKFYLHINAMGAGEYYGSNRNADYFPEQMLKDYHKTFEETGFVYRHHVNKDPAKSMGKVIFSIYNERMHRVELIAELDMILAKDIYDKIQRGEFPKTSMACKTPWDICSICGNKATTPQKYCEHIKEQPNKVMPDGRKVMALNLAPLRFFDISIVIRPADPTSSVLQKVASANCVLSTDEAIEAGLYDDLEASPNNLVKRAAMKKLSELVKKIDSGHVMRMIPTQKKILDQLDVTDDEMLSVLSSVPLEQSLNALAEIGTIPSQSFLAEMIARHKLKTHIPEGFGEVASEISQSVPSDVLLNNVEGFMDDIAEVPADSFLLKYLRNKKPLLMSKQANHDGYADAGVMFPKMYYTTQDKRQAIQNIQQEAAGNPSVFSLLLKIGGAALLAKMIISHLIDSKIDKLEKNRLKSPSMTKVAALVEISIIRDITNAKLNRK